MSVHWLFDREDNQALTDDYKRITEQFRELQKKSRWEKYSSLTFIILGFYEQYFFRILWNKGRYYHYLPFLFRHFQTTDQKKFHDIWAMNEEQVRELVHSVLEEDRIIHEQQLGLPWEAPDL